MRTCGKVIRVKLGHEDEAPMGRISVLIRRDNRELPFPTLLNLDSLLFQNTYTEGRSCEHTVSRKPENQEESYHQNVTMLAL